MLADDRRPRPGDRHLRPVAPTSCAPGSRTWSEVDHTPLTLLFESFAFKFGVPLDADLVFDVRILPNPVLRPGAAPADRRDAAGRRNSSMRSRKPRELLDDIRDFVEKWLPSFKNDNRSYLTVAHRLHRRPAPFGVFCRASGGLFPGCRAGAEAPSRAGLKPYPPFVPTMSDTRLAAAVSPRYRAVPGRRAAAESVRGTLYRHGARLHEARCAVRRGAHQVGQGSRRRGRARTGWAALRISSNGTCRISAC